MANIISKINSAVKKVTSSIGGKTQTASAATAKAPTTFKNPAGYKPVATTTKLSSTGAPMSVAKPVSGVLKVPNQTLASSIKNYTPYAGSYAQTTGYKAPTTVSKGTSGSSVRSASLGSALATGQDFGAQNSSSNFSDLSSLGSNQGMGNVNLPSSNVINAPNVLGTSNTKLTIPEQTTPDYSSAIPIVNPVDQQDPTKQREDSLKDYLKQLTEAPSSADAYNRAQRETGILEKQKLVGDLTGTLNGIVARGQANQLAQVGQGRGIPEAIIGGIQAQIGRETAIAALPIQAQLEAAQGNLEMANDNLDKLFKIYSDDAKNEYEYKKEQKKMVYEYATEKEKRALEKLDKQEERAYQEKKDILATNKTIAIEAAKNGATAGTLTKIANAGSLAEAISTAGKYMLNTQVVKLDNGNTVVIDSTGRVIKSLGGAKAETGNNFVITKDTLKNTYGNDVVSLIASTIKATGAKQNQSTNDAINVISGLQQLVKDAPNGVFKGLAPLRLLPNKAKSTEALTNLSNIEAVNLKVQQWASGAALTDAQTKQVAKMTPQKGDTDKQVQAKANALANYMVSQVSGQLAGQGVGFSIDKVDLFTKTPEQELKQLYQSPAMKQKIQQAVQMFPNYTDAEILQIIQI